jgi:WD40 repeat protein
MPRDFKYRAFISYSHKDRQWGDWLHRRLESYRIPRSLVGVAGRDGPLPAKLFPVFRDREELPSSADLSSQVQQALEDSASLIVICSPHSARSRWVNEEILAFKRLGREDRISAIIVAGEPNAELGSGLNPDDECFPTALKFKLGADGALSTARVEPVAADSRPTGDGRENSLLKLIAGILGIPYDNLKQRELVAARRRARVAQAIAASMIVLALAASIGGIISWAASSVAQQRLAAAQIAESESVLEKVQALPPEIAVPALLEVLPRNIAKPDRPFVDAVAAQLALTMNLWSDVAQFAPHPPQPIYRTRFAASAPVLLISTGPLPASVAAFDLHSDKAEFLMQFPDGILDMDLTDDGARIAVSTRQTGAPVAIYSTSGTNDIGYLWKPQRENARDDFSQAVQTPDGSIFAESEPGGTPILTTFDPASGRVLDVAIEECARPFDASTWLARGGAFAIIWCGDGRLVLWKLARKPIRIGEVVGVHAERATFNAPPPLIAISPDQQMLAIDAAGDGTISFINLHDGSERGEFALSDRRVVGFRFAGQDLLVVHADGTWEGLSPSGLTHKFVRPSIEPTQRETVRASVLSNDGQSLVLALSGGAVEIWSWRRDQRIARIEIGDEADLSAIASDHAGTGFMLGRLDGTVEWHDIDKPERQKRWTVGSGAVTRLSADIGDEKVLIGTKDARFCTLNIRIQDQPNCTPLAPSTKLLQQLTPSGGLLTLSDDGHSLQIADSGNDSTIRLVDPDMNAAFQKIRFDHTGGKIAVASFDNEQLVVLDTRNGQPVLRTGRLGDTIETLAFDPSDRFLVAQGPWGAAVYDTVGGVTSPVWKSDTQISAAYFTQDHLLVSEGDGTIHAYHTGSWSEEPPEGFKNVRGKIMGLDRAGTTMLVQLRGLAGLAIWTRNSERPTNFYHSTGNGLFPIGDLSADGTLVAYAGLGSPQDTNIHLVSAVEQKPGRKLPSSVSMAPIVAAGFSPDGNYLVTAADDGQIAVTAVGGDGSKSITCNCGQVTGLSVNTDAILAISREQAVLFDRQSLAEKRRINIAGMPQGWASTDRNLDFLLLEGGTATVVPLKTDEPVQAIGDPLDLSFLKQERMAWLSSNGARVAWVQRNVLNWGAPRSVGEQHHSLQLDARVISGAINNKGSEVALALGDGRLQLVDLDEGSARATIADIGNQLSIAFVGPNDSYVLLHQFSGRSALIDANSGESRIDLAAPTGAAINTEIVVPAGPSRLIGLLPGVDQISGRGTAMVWDTATMLPIKTVSVERPDDGPKLLIGGDPGVGLIGSDDGKLGFVFHEGRAADLLDLAVSDIQTEIDTACSRIKRPLTENERRYFHLSAPAQSSTATNLLRVLPSAISSLWLPSHERASCGG